MIITFNVMTMMIVMVRSDDDELTCGCQSDHV